MPDQRRQTWRAARSTLIVAAVFGAVCLVGLSLAAWLIFDRQGQILVPVILLVVALAGAGYAWRFGLHPRISAEADELVIENPFRTFSFDWRDITALWPGSDGVVVASPEQRVEAWCVQKSNAAIRDERRSRADEVCDALWQRWEEHHPPETTEDGLLIRRARPGEQNTLAELERSAMTAALGHVFPAQKFPYPIDAVTTRWREVLRDPSKQTVLAVRDETAVGYGAHDGRTVLHLGVAGDRQRSGVGGQLLAWVEEEIFSDPTLAEAGLWVLEENGQARSFYRDHGWRDTEDRRQSEFPPKPVEMRMIKANPRAARRGRR